MSPINQNNDTPYFFLSTEQYALGTPRGIAASDRTFDIPFQDLAGNYDLQTKLKLASSIFIKPDVTYADPLVGSKLHQAVAVYLSSFANDPAEQQQRRDYLLNNGLVRILVSDNTLREKVRKVA